MHLLARRLLDLRQRLYEIHLGLAPDGVDQVVHDGDLVVHDRLVDGSFVPGVKGEGLGTVLHDGFCLCVRPHERVELVVRWEACALPAGEKCPP